MSSPRPPNWLGLPNEVWLGIVEALRGPRFLEELGSLARVCVKLNTVTKTPALWRKVDLGAFGALRLHLFFHRDVDMPALAHIEELVLPVVPVPASSDHVQRTGDVNTVLDRDILRVIDHNCTELRVLTVHAALLPEGPISEALQAKVELDQRSSLAALNRSLAHFHRLHCHIPCCKFWREIRAAESGARHKTLKHLTLSLCGCLRTLPVLGLVGPPHGLFELHDLLLDPIIRLSAPSLTELELRFPWRAGCALGEGGGEGGWDAAHLRKALRLLRCLFRYQALKRLTVCEDFDGDVAAVLAEVQKQRPKLAITHNCAVE